MAARYWVGGTAAWDATAGTKWALTDGGAGGQAVPTSADDVFFTALSGAVTVTVSAVGFCQNLTTTGFTGTLTGGSNIRVNGSLLLNAGMTFTHTGFIQFTATSGSYTVTTAGKTLGAASFSLAASAAVWTLQDALTCTGGVDTSGGTLTTNNFNVTATSLLSSGSNVRAINLGSSTVTLSSTGTTFNTSTNTNLTFNAGTSSIVLSGAAAGLFGGGVALTGLTFYNVSATGTVIGTITIGGINTFNNVTVIGSAAAGVRDVVFDSRQTINGTLSTTGTAGNRRVWFRGITYGLAQTLTINSAPSLTDADFRDIYVIGTAAPISGTRIGNRAGCRGITFSTPKTVYWATLAGGSWSGTNWAISAGGAVSNDNFPLAQDTATFVNTGLNTSATVTVDSLMTGTSLAMSGVDFSARSNAMTFATGSVTPIIYGNWLGNAQTVSGTGALTFGSRSTQTINGLGKPFSQPITVDSYGGLVELGGALNIGTQTLTVTNGTFDTKNYNVTAGAFEGFSNSVKALKLGSSTITLSGGGFGFYRTNQTTVDAGTSTIICASSNSTTYGGGLTLYNLSYTSTSVGTHNFQATGGVLTVTNLTFTAPASAGLRNIFLAENQTITGTLTVAGASPVRRIFVFSSTLGATRTLTVNSLSATDCDFRDITIAGAAAGSSQTRAGDCGGNAGITFPSPKTVYWNLAGAQNWSATAWATGSGGTPNANNFPLAQDTAAFDNAGSVTGTITIDQTWNTGAINALSRTSAMTLSASNPLNIHGDLTFGTGVTTTGFQTFNFIKRGNQTITSNGVLFSFPISVNNITYTVQLADAITFGSGGSIIVTTGTFDAVTYNVTVGATIDVGSGLSRALKMGSGTWTFTGTGSTWNVTNTTNLTFYKGTANIVLSDTSTSARTFVGGGLSYNKLTIGGATGTSTTTISGNNQFTEIASTKTVAHTIDLGATRQTFGKWSVTGTAGNVVTVAGTGITHDIAGSRVSGVDYLAMGTTGFIATSPGEFYAGANSTGTNATIIKTAAPAPVTRYWVGGTGTWSTTNTTNWSDTSGGAGGFSVPTSADAVVFDSASNATAYTVTCTATQLRCGSLTMAGPASGNVLWTGTAPLAIHDSVTLAVTGITRTYTGNITLSGSTNAKTLTTNGVALASTITVNGIGCGWSLGSALSMPSNRITLTNGSFSFGSYSSLLTFFTSSNSNTRTVDFGSATLVLNSTSGLDFGLTGSEADTLTVISGTSQINISSGSAPFTGNGKTFYNVLFTDASPGTITFNGANTFNNLSFSGLTSAGLKNISITANQTVTDTLSFLAGTNATMRTFLQSSVIGTTRTVTCANFLATDTDFRDITIAGAAAPVSGTRLGDCKGNSGITFPAAKTVYFKGTASNNWTATVWSLTDGGTADANNFPLAQDTVIVSATQLNSGSTLTINATYNIGTLDMSARTSNTMTLACSFAPFIYGNWINGTGTNLSGSGTLTFAGRGSQTITSAGVGFTAGAIIVDSPAGSVTVQDAFNLSTAGSILRFRAGTFNANTYNITIGGFDTSAGLLTQQRTLAVSSGTWTVNLASTNPWNITVPTTVTGTGTVSLTNASAKTFAGGGISYSGITLNQGGAGTLTITGNNTFANITNTYSATGATTIALGTTTQRVGTFGAKGEAGRVLTVQGTSASSPATLVFTGSGTATTAATDYLAITGVRAYDLTTTWYAGANSINNGSLGWYFEATPGGAISVFIIESATSADAQSGAATINVSMSETTTAADAQAAGFICLGTLSESATAADVVEAFRAFLASVAESATASDLLSASLVLTATVSELTAGVDSLAVQSVLNVPIAELASASDSLSGGLLFLSNITEATTAQEIATAVLIFNRSVSEAASVSEVIAAVAAFNAAVPESVSGSEVASALINIGGSVNEALTALDSAVGPKTTRPTVSESAAASESETSIYTTNPAISEVAQPTDASAVVASTFGASSAETASPLDSAQGANTGSSSLSENAAVSDAAATAFVPSTAVSEQAAAQETEAAAVTLQGALSETAAGADQSSVAPSNFSAVAIAVAQALDSQNAPGSIYNAALPIQGAGITDSFIGAYLWNPIPDDQTPNWGAIVNEQTPSWVAVSDSQTPNWQNIPNPQGSGWTQINTDDDPNWQPTIQP